MGLPYTFKAFEHELAKHLSAEDSKKFDEFKKLAWDGDEHAKSHSQKEELDKWLKDNGYEEIDYERPAGVSFKKLGEDDTDSKLVDSYKKWLENKFFPEYDSEEKDYEKEFKEKNAWYRLFNDKTLGLCFTVLDLLLKYYDGKSLEDPDTQYWSMKKALSEFVQKYDLKNWKGYCWWSEKILKQAGVEEKDLKEALDNLGIIQLELKQQDVDL